MKIAERGQIVIPKRLREKYGLFTSTEIQFIEEEDGLRIKKYVHNPVKKVFGILKKNGNTMDYLENIRGK